MKVSVILSTYNGSKYILEQLNSINGQTVAVDEVLICDDCSTDNTAGIIEKFINEQELGDKWKLITNTINRGWKRNFYELFLKSSGEYIFACDQDDIWEETKVERMTNSAIREDAILVASDYIAFYEERSVRLPRAKISRISNNHSLEKIENLKAMLLIDRPGCTYCISSKIKDVFRILWFEDYPHDALIWRIAFVLDSLYILHEPLIKYRRHALNTSDYKNRSISERISVAEYFVHFLKDMKNSRDQLRIDNRKQKYIDRSLFVQQKRIEVLKQRNLLAATLLIIYIFYYPTVNTYLADIQAILYRK